VDRDGEAAMGRAGGGVIAMRAKMRFILRRIAGDDIALHAGDVELVDLRDLRIDPPLDAPLRLDDDLPILDIDILAPLMAVVMYGDGLAADLAHEAGFGAALSFIEGNQLAAEIGLEDMRQHDHRRL